MFRFFQELSNLSQFKIFLYVFPPGAPIEVSSCFEREVLRAFQHPQYRSSLVVGRGARIGGGGGLKTWNGRTLTPWPEGDV